MKTKLLIILIALGILGWWGFLWRHAVPIERSTSVIVNDFGAIKKKDPCVGLDEVWKHVYAGDPRRFSKPQDRLRVVEPCKTVSGTIYSAKAEKDGDFHLRLDVDSQFKNLLNAKNMSGQKGMLVIEPVCMNPVSQKNTLEEGVCNGYRQDVYQKSMLHKHVEVIGAYVEDREHGWREIHPVLSITVK